jgi:hypothetical protein
MYSSDSVYYFDPTQENRARLRKMVGQELRNSISEASISWAEKVYEDISTPAAIEEYLDGDNGYRDGRWTILPESPSGVTELHKPIQRIINSIIECFGTPKALDARQAMICELQREVLDDGDSDDEREPPTTRAILIRGTGRSFSSPIGSCVGFSNAATCFGVEVDSAAKEIWSHLVLMAEFAK